MGTSIFNIGVSGLNAAQAGLLTTGHNISNASTPGFNRQQIVQTTQTPQFTGAGFLGQGTSVQTVQRLYSQHLAGQVLTSQTRLSELTAYGNEIRQIDNLLADPEAGLSPALSQFFSGVQEVAANPASLPARQSMLSAAQALTARFQSLDSRFNEIRDGVDAQIAGTVEAINAFSTQIAELNQRIILAQAAGPGQPANDLLDQRDKLVAELNQQIRVTTVTESSGSLSVFIGNGQPVVVGAQAFALAAVASGADASRITVGVSQGGSSFELPESLLAGGTLGGLLAFRSQTLDPAQNALGRIALGLAETFNAQHRLGQDLAGALGGDFFTAPTPQVVYPNNPVNGGSAAIGVAVSAVADLTASDYRLTADGGGNFTLTRLSDGATLFSAAALPQTVDGLTISVSAGAANAGDSFLLQPTRSAAGDIAVALTDARGIAAAAPIRTASSLANTGTATVSAGSVSSVASLPAAGSPITLAYDAAGGSFSGFPAGSTVTVTSGGTTSTYNITASTDPVAYVSGATISFNGMSLAISGTPGDGDKFSIERNASGVSDSRNALLLGALQTSRMLLGGAASYQSAYAQIVSDVGNKAREIEVTATAQETMLTRAEEARQSLSGVNLDEEAANLLRYQQAYQASGKMIDIASKLFELLLGLGR